MKKLLQLLTILSIIPVFSQNLLKRVSADAELVIEFGMDKLEKIYPHKKVFKNAMWMDIAKKENMKSMIETGIDFKKPGYLAIDMTDSCTYFSIHFSIANKKQFINLVTKNMRNKSMYDDYKGSGITYIQNGRDENLLLTDKSATFAFCSMNRDYGRENQDYLLEVYYDDIKEYEYEYQQRNAIEGIFGRERMLKLIKNNPNPFEQSTCFKMIDEREEINVWINKLYSKLGGAINDRDIKQFSKLFSSFDAYQTFQISADPGAVNAKIKMNFDQDINSEIDKMTEGRKLRADFLNYIPNDYLGMYMMSINPKAYYDWLKKSLVNAIGGNYIKEESLNDAVELIETLIDEEAIANILSGDLLFAYNGMEKVEKEYQVTTYDEDFKRIETTKTREIEFPEFTMVIGVNNKKFFQKIIDIIERENIAKQQNGYFILPGQREFPTGFGIKLQNDKLIISNDFELFDRIEKKDMYQTNLTNLDRSFYANLKLNVIFDEMLKNTRNYTDYTMASLMKKYVSSIQMYSYDVDNGMGVKGQIEFVDKKKNSYTSIVNMLNEFYLQNELKRDEGKFEFYSKGLKEMMAKYESLPADKKTLDGDKLYKQAEELLKSKKAKEEPYMLRKATWELEEVMESKSYENPYYEYENYEKSGETEEVEEEK